MLTEYCIPTKCVTVGPRDPLVKSTLKQRYRLRKGGHTVEADALATKINYIIQDNRANQCRRLTEASSKELCRAAVKTTTGNPKGRIDYPVHITCSRPSTLSISIMLQCVAILITLLTTYCFSLDHIVHVLIHCVFDSTFFPRQCTGIYTNDHILLTSYEVAVGIKMVGEIHVLAVV